MFYEKNDAAFDELMRDMSAQMYALLKPEPHEHKFCRHGFCTVPRCCATSEPMTMEQSGWHDIMGCREIGR